MRRGDWVRYRKGQDYRTGIIEDIYLDGSQPMVVVKHPLFRVPRSCYYSDVSVISQPIPLAYGMVISFSGRVVTVNKVDDTTFGYGICYDYLDVYYEVINLTPQELVNRLNCKEGRKLTLSRKDNSYLLTEEVKVSRHLGSEKQEITYLLSELEQDND